jgi:D-alanyl-lipoteichoic acid acyltransferase DltB (MBOAT superfamily)
LAIYYCTSKQLYKTSLITVFLSLGFFKYFSTDIGILAPVGISFICFQVLSYIWDLQDNPKLKKDSSLLNFMAYIMLFPQLIAGPICRAGKIIPNLGQLHSKFKMNNSIMFKILEGLFFKVVIADSLALKIDGYFLNPPNHIGNVEWWIISFAYSIRIYFDFHAYSLIAIGLCEMLGINIPTNFSRPYSAISSKDFWRKWHISLSTWFRDYVYLKLGGNNLLSFHSLSIAFLTFFISGLWHGGSFNFMLWGCLHGLWYCFERALGWDYTKKESKCLKGFLKIKTFLVVSFLWVFFACTNLTNANFLISKLLFIDRLTIDTRFFLEPGWVIFILVISLILLFRPDLEKFYQRLLISSILSKFYIVLLFSLVILYRQSETLFIYYRF